LTLLWAVPAAAVLSDADKCEAAKNKEAGKSAFCRQKAEATAIKKGTAPDYTKCTRIVTSAPRRGHDPGALPCSPARSWRYSFRLGIGRERRSRPSRLR